MVNVVPSIIEKYISTGGDERIVPITEGRIKYNFNVVDYKGLFSRGSCTCNAVNEISYPLMNRIEDNDASFLNLRNEHERKIKEILNFKGQDNFDVVFAPSGSELHYIHLMFSKILYPNKDIKVMLTCPEELGSGTQLAFLGKYYGAKGPHGHDFEIGEDINGKYNISVERFAARSSDGRIMDHKSPINNVIDTNVDYSLIGSLVIGSKSGIEDDISLIPSEKNDTMWVVDLCQFRNSKKLVNELLDKNCMVMITGSKFYMSPPFSGAMLIPKKLSQRIASQDIADDIIKGFNTIFSYYDFPKELESLRSHFSKVVNKGLILRWEAAIGAMETFDSMDMNVVNSIVDDWNDRMKLKIDESPYFKLMPHQDRTNKTIISFKVKGPDNKFLDSTSLKAFHKDLVTSAFDYKPYNKVFIGQPVKYGLGAFIRIAIGAVNIHKMSEVTDEERFVYDDILIDHISKRASQL